VNFSNIEEEAQSRLRCVDGTFFFLRNDKFLSETNFFNICMILFRIFFFIFRNIVILFLWPFYACVDETDVFSKKERQWAIIRASVVMVLMISFVWF